MRLLARAPATGDGRDRREETRCCADGEKRREERETFGRGGNATVYQVREKLLSIGDDLWIENGAGERVFKVNGKALRVRKTLVFEDTEGRELCKIQSRVLRVRDSMEIEGPDGERLAMVKKAVISPLRERWVVDRPDLPDLKVQGNILDHEYEIEEDGRRSPRSPSAGSACATPTAWRSRPGRTTSSCSPSRPRSTR